MVFLRVIVVDENENPKSVINDNTTFYIHRPENYIDSKETKLVALMPEQEKQTLFMFHRKEKEGLNIMRRDSPKTNALYLTSREFPTCKGGVVH
jgi:hypothetical protein